MEDIEKQMRGDGQALEAFQKALLAALQQRLFRAPKLAHAAGEVHVTLHAQQVVPVLLPDMIIVIDNHHSSIHCRQALQRFQT